MQLLDHLEAPDAVSVTASGAGQPVEERDQQRLAHRRGGEVEQRVDLGQPVGEGEPAVGAGADQAGGGEQAVEVGVGERGRVEGLDEGDHVRGRR